MTNLAYLNKTPRTNFKIGFKGDSILLIIHPNGRYLCHISNQIYSGEALIWDLYGNYVYLLYYPTLS